MVRPESINAYRHMQKIGMISQQEFDIVDYLLKTGNKALTRREIEEGTNIRGGSVAGRVNHLIKKEILAETLSRKCKISGFTALPVFVKLDKQGEIF